MGALRKLDFNARMEESGRKPTPYLTLRTAALSFPPLFISHALGWQPWGSDFAGLR